LACSHRWFTWPAPRGVPPVGSYPTLSPITCAGDLVPGHRLVCSLLHLTWRRAYATPPLGLLARAAFPDRGVPGPRESGLCSTLLAELGDPVVESPRRIGSVIATCSDSDPLGPFLLPRLSPEKEAPKLRGPRLRPATSQSARSGRTPSRAIPHGSDEDTATDNLMPATFSSRMAGTSPGTHP
jgi:hypothetical protein